MSSSSTASDPIPRYIRYKARHKRWFKCWDDEIERANSIVHERVQRMKRDKLCSGCARFDWIRTQFYTREVVRRDGRLPVRKNMVTLAEQKLQPCPTLDDLIHVGEWLDDMQDNVPWQEYEAALLESPDTSELMNHPRFEWDIDHNQQQSCTLCRSLCSTSTSREPLATRVSCRAGPLIEGGNNHDCSFYLKETSGWGNHPINAIIFDIGYASNFQRCYFRPTVSDTGSSSSAVPHCCLVTRPLGHTIDFSLVAKWLKTYDDTHQHSKQVETRDLDQKLTGFRLIDVTKRCIVKSSLKERYAALSYTWAAKNSSV